MTQETIYILGAGGHGKVVADCLRAGGHMLAGFFDADPKRHGTEVLGLPVLGGDEGLADLDRTTVLIAIGVGSVGRPDVRRGLYERVSARGFRIARAIHPSAVIAADVLLGEGVHAMAGAVVNPGTRIGENTILNTRAGVDHDCDIGAHVHIAPGATLSGDVTVGEGCHIGTGAAIRNGVGIGARAVVGVGAAVVGDVPAGATVVGVPAREVTE